MARDPYIVLGVDRSATLDEIKTAYRRRAHETHPDRHPNDPHAAGRYRAANEAWAAIQTERGVRPKVQYEAPEAAAEPSPARRGMDTAADRFVRQVVATGVTAAEAAVERAADRLSAQGGWRSVLGEALRGAAGGLAQGVERIRTGPTASARADVPRPESGEPRR